MVEKDSFEDWEKSRKEANKLYKKLKEELELYPKEEDKFEILLNQIKELKTEVLILAGGLGVPCLSTDTTAAIRASELNIDYILKGTNVDGVYDSDPKTNPNAIKYDKLSFKEALEKHLQIMDTSAFEICMKNNVKLIIYNATDLNNIIKVCNGDTIGTIVENYE